MAKKKTKKDNWGQLIELDNNIVYNPESDTYIAFLKKQGRNVLVRGELHRAIIESYSDLLGEPATMAELSRMHGIPREVLSEYISIIGLTHAELPVSKEVLKEKSVDELAQSFLEKKKFKVVQEFLKRDWQDTKRNANKWIEFQEGSLKPFQEVINKWSPPRITGVKTPTLTCSGKNLVIGLSDLHWGSAARQRYMFQRRGDWSTKDTVELVDNYSKAIIQSAKERKYPFDKVIILFLGDFLHSANGKTLRGTELKFDCVREEQLDYALTSLVSFVGKIASAFPQVEIHTTGGNHNYEAEIALYRAVELAFNTVPRVKFHHYSARPGAFLVDNTLFLMDHGADSVERTYVPTKESELKTHVNSLLVNCPELVLKAKSKLFVQGDKHVFKHIEFGTFEFVMFPTSLGADQHADTNNWSNRPRQSCLVLDETGLKEVLHFYTDELVPKLK